MTGFLTRAYQWAFVPHPEDRKHRTMKHSLFSLAFMTVLSSIAIYYLDQYFDPFVEGQANVRYFIPLA